MKTNWLNRIGAVLAAGLLLGGCVSERPSDLTLDELEMRMAQAMDPAKKYRNAYAYLQRQNIEEDELFGKKRQFVEVRFQRPDKFKFSFFDENRVCTEILSTGGRAWTVDHLNGIVSEITGDALAKVKVMLALGHPDTDYDMLFERVDVSLVTLDDDREYYKLVCYANLPDSDPITIYIDREQFLPKRLELTLKTPGKVIQSASEIVEYQVFDTIKIPTLTHVTEGSREYDTRVVGYLLNPQFKNDEFAVPQFDPVLMEMKKRKLRDR